MTDNPWEPWMSPEEIAADARVTPYSASLPLPTPVQLERMSALSITPILMRRPSALVYLGALSADGGGVDNDCRRVGPTVDNLVPPRPQDRQRRITLARDLHERGFSLRAIAVFTGWSKSQVSRLLDGGRAP